MEPMTPVLNSVITQKLAGRNDTLEFQGIEVLSQVLKLRGVQTKEL